MQLYLEETSTALPPSTREPNCSGSLLGDEDDDRVYPAISMGMAMLAITFCGFICIIFYIFIKFTQEVRAERRWSRVRVRFSKNDDRFQKRKAARLVHDDATAL